MERTVRNLLQDLQPQHPAPANNQLAPLASTDLSGPASGSTPATGSTAVAPLAFYDSAAENLTLTCNLTLTNTAGSTLNVMAASPQIMVEKPTVTKWNIYTGYVQHVQDPTTNQTGYQLRQGPTSTQAGGEAWQNATIVVPSPFTATGGTGCFAQLITPDTEFTNDTPSKVPTNPTNKQQGLDNSFPYSGDKWDVSGLGAGADSPVLYYENLNSGGYAGWTKASENDSFTTWVMYQPPGGVWVPLQSYNWTWSFTSTWDSSQSAWTLFRANPPYATSDPGYTGTNTPNPPQWSLVQNNTPPASK